MNDSHSERWKNHPIGRWEISGEKTRSSCRNWWRCNGRLALELNRYYLISAATALRQDDDLLRVRSIAYDVSNENHTDTRGAIAIMGPNAEGLLSKLSDKSLGSADFPWLSFQSINIAGVEVEALRVSYVGESGWELHHEIGRQKTLFEHLVQAGQSYDIGFYGAFAMNCMKLKKVIVPGVFDHCSNFPDMNWPNKFVPTRLRRVEFIRPIGLLSPDY